MKEPSRKAAIEAFARGNCKRVVRSSIRAVKNHFADTALSRASNSPTKPLSNFR